MSAVDIDNTEAPGSLTHCPFCRYDLQGLPRNYRCPECGFEYDESMQAWGHRLSSLKLWISYPGKFTYSSLFLLPLIFNLFKNRPSLMLGSIAAVLVVTISIDKWRGGQNQFIIASKEGVAVSNSKKMRKLSWRTFWVPNPDNPKELPPWIKQWNDDLRWRNGLIDILFRIRPDRNSRRAALFEPVIVGLFWINNLFRGMISLERIGNRKTRKAMMRELRRRWEEANGSDGIADDQA